MKIKTIGIVLETQADAEKLRHIEINDLYHWREPKEIEIIQNTLNELGFNTIIIGSQETLLEKKDKYQNEIDFILNLSVGFISRYRLSTGPNLYSLLNIPYSGADPYTKMISQNKHMMKAFWDKMNIPTPEWVYITSSDDLKNISYPEFPLIVKPAYEGSSIGITNDSVVYNTHDLNDKIDYIFHQMNMPVIVEKFIPGSEYKVGIIGNDKIEFCKMIEDVKSDGKSLNDEFLFFDHKTEGHYKKRKVTDIAIIANIIRDSLKIYNHFLPVDFGTMDLRVDKNGQYYFLEFNADATLHPERTLAKCCELHGLTYKKMLELILDSSFKRWSIE